MEKAELFPRRVLSVLNMCWFLGVLAVVLSHIRSARPRRQVALWITLRRPLRLQMTY